MRPCSTPVNIHQPAHTGIVMLMPAAQLIQAVQRFDTRGWCTGRAFSSNFNSVRKPATAGRGALSHTVSLMTQLQVGDKTGHVVLI